MPFFAFSQQFKLHGAVVDVEGQPISNAIVILSNTKDSSNILFYTNTESDGKFIFEAIKSEKDSIYLTIKHLQFKTFQKKIPCNFDLLNIKLELNTEQLKEVLIAKPKIVKIKGDTITYNVDGLKAKKDYTIEEVIARIPGVTISENGQIKYLEKAISHLYINGLDLLEGRYSIATRGIPATAVKEIDVLTKHNHERINIGRTESDKVSLNLKIKEGQSVVFGSSKNEAGLPFLTGLADITPVYLKNKLQNIGSLKANNIGESLKSYSESATVDDLNILSLKLTDTPIINPTNTNGLLLSNKYWLGNQSLAATNDALVKISDSTLVKCSMNFVKENTGIQKQTLSTFLNNNTSNEILTLNTNHLKTLRFQLGVSQEINKRKFFLKNSTHFKITDDSGVEQIVLNQNGLESQYQNNNTKFSNITLIKNLVSKNKILNSGLILEYEKQAEALFVTPPVFLSTISYDATAESTNQQVTISKRNIAAFTDYAFDWIKINWNIEQNVSYNDFHFNSNLAQIPSLGFTNFPFQSEFKFQKITASTQLRFTKNIEKLTFKLNLFADYNGINTQELNSNAEKSNFLFFQPFFSIKFNVNAKWSASISYSQNSKVSDFSKIFQPVIMTSFNTLVQNPSIINTLRTKTFAPSLFYSNILNSLFFSIKGNFSRIESDVTFISQLNNLGFITTNVLPRTNIVNSNILSLNCTKGIFAFFKTDMSYSFSFSENELFFNNQFVDIKNNNHNLNFGLTIDNGTWYSFAYKINYLYNTTTSASNKFNNIFIFYNTNLDFYTSPKTQINFVAESTQAKTNNNYNKNILFNFSLLYKPSKKLFIKVAVLNIFDTSFFSTVFGASNAITVSQFSLRPRQITFGLTYSF